MPSRMYRSAANPNSAAAKRTKSDIDPRTGDLKTKKESVESAKVRVSKKEDDFKRKIEALQKSGEVVSEARKAKLRKQWGF